MVTHLTFKNKQGEWVEPRHVEKRGEILIDNNLVEEIRDNMFYSLIEKYKKRYKEIEVGKLISYFTIVPNIYQDLIYRFLRYIVPYIGGILLLSLYLKNVPNKQRAIFFLITKEK